MRFFFCASALVSLLWGSVGKMWISINYAIMTIRFIIKNVPATGRKGHHREVAKVRTSIYVRIRDGREIDYIARTGLLVYPKWWNRTREELNASSACPENERLMTNNKIIGLRNYLTQKYIDDRTRGLLSGDWLHTQIGNYFCSEKDSGLSLQALFASFYAERGLSQGRIRQYETLKNAITRFEYFVRNKNGYKYGHGFSFLTADDNVVFRLYDYLLNEKVYLQTCPLPVNGLNGPVRARSINTVNSMLRKIRAFLNWCISRGYLSKSPFDSYHIGGELYGTPVCMTNDEVLKLYRYEFDSVQLSRQRDVFVFQCNIGCRVSDLMRLTTANCNDGCISFIPQKTMRTNARTVTVPMNSIAREIYNKYAADASDGNIGKRLLPCISVQKYNAAIKHMLRKAGITRPVTILDPLTRTEKSVPICDMASSHMARRTFINSIYRKVKDPELVASLTGHSEGSRAFSRYRTIDTAMKKELVRILEK